MDKYYIDPQWCFDNHEDAAKELERLHRWCDDLEDQRDQLRGVLEECLDALVGCAVPAGGCDDKKHILDAQRSARAALKATEEG